MVVVDKTNELAGDGISPHQAIGEARWMPVGKLHMQVGVRGALEGGAERSMDGSRNHPRPRPHLLPPPLSPLSPPTTSPLSPPQAQVLREAVENQSPDIIICDEISTVSPCMLALTQRRSPHMLALTQR